MSRSSDQPPLAITRTCKMPCHDCPFRTDIPKYQSLLDVAFNTAALLGSHMALTHCHHSARKGSEPVACAGFLTAVAPIRRQVEIFPNPNPQRLKFDPNHDIPVYTSIEAFLQSACPDQSELGRRIAWLLCQPRHKRTAGLRKLMENMAEVEDHFRAKGIQNPWPQLLNPSRPLYMRVKDGKSATSVATPPTSGG